MSEEVAIKRGVGRPPGDTVRIFATVKRETAEKLERIANEAGFKRKRGSRLPFFGGAIDKLAESVTPPEPEYLQLAKG